MVHAVRGDPALLPLRARAGALGATVLHLSDPAMEDMLYEVESVRRFCGISLERHGLGRKLFERINEDLARKVCC